MGRLKLRRAGRSQRDLASVDREIELCDEIRGLVDFLSIVAPDGWISPPAFISKETRLMLQGRYWEPAPLTVLQRSRDDLARWLKEAL